MTDETTVLIRRPRWVQPIPDEPGRPLLIASLRAAISAVVSSLLIAMAIALAGWYLADGGSHGQATDALRIGADGWLLGHGTTITAEGIPLGIVPLGLTALLLVVGHRCGRRAGRTVTSVPDNARLFSAIATATAAYVVATLIISLVVARGSADVDLAQAFLGAILVCVCGVGSGIVMGSGRGAQLWEAVPGHLRSVLQATVTSVGCLLAAGGLLVAAGLAVSFNDSANMMSALDLSFGNALMLLLAGAVLVPNAALLGVSFLAGPGFAVGTGTSVTAAAVTLGPLPAFPLLTALPGDGVPPGWLTVVYAVPILCAAIGAGLAQRRYAVPAWDSAALRGFGGGVAAAVVTALLVALAGGPMGADRLAHIGAPVGELLVVLVGGMGLGGLAGGIVVAFGQRRSERADA